MKKIDKDGLILCELQARAFELSAKKSATSSEIFIRRFMHSDIARSLDNGDILLTNLLATDILDRVEEQYGSSTYGSVKYSEDELYWIGYFYRYYSYTYDVPSLHAYKTVKPKELRGVYLPYHTLDTAQAIERVLEARNLIRDDKAELLRQYEIYKAIRNGEVEHFCTCKMLE